MRAELLVVGAGPAGLAAALAAADAGAAVTLVDANSTLGGQYFRQPAAGPSTMPKRLGRAATHPGIRLLLGTQVRGADGLRFALTGGVYAAAKALVIATGATELALPFPGWDLPGVVTAGAAQALLKGQGVPIGRRVIVGGSGPFLLPVAAALVTAGVQVAGVFEATGLRTVGRPLLAAAAHTGKVAEAAGYLKTLAGKGIRPRTGYSVTRCTGTDRVREAIVSRVDRDWRPIPGTEWQVAADAVCVSYGFTPALELPRSLGVREVDGAVWHDDRQATDVPGVFVAGETTGVGGARLAEAEGIVAGLAAARSLGHPPRMSAAPALAAIRAERRFARRLERLYPRRTGWLEWLGPETVFCRCEESTWGDVADAMAAGAHDARSVKGLSRCGMGYCQGRVCGPPLVAAIAATTGNDPRAVGDLQRRTIATPVPLSELAAE